MTGLETRADRTSGSRREVNLQAHAYAVRVGRSLPEERWEFLCECDDGSCEERVRLRLDEYTGLRADEEPILASGHVLSPRELARRWAERLLEPTQALVAQAKHRVRRATRSPE